MVSTALQASAAECKFKIICTYLRIDSNCIYGSAAEAETLTTLMQIYTPKLISNLRFTTITVFSFSCISASCLCVQGLSLMEPQCMLPLTWESAQESIQKQHEKNGFGLNQRGQQWKIRRNNNRSLSLVAWQCVTHGAELQKTRQTEVKRSSPPLTANSTDCTLPLYLSVSHKNIL